MLSIDQVKLNAYGNNLNIEKKNLNYFNIILKKNIENIERKDLQFDFPIRYTLINRFIRILS